MDFDFPDSGDYARRAIDVEKESTTEILELLNKRIDNLENIVGKILEHLTKGA